MRITHSLAIIAITLSAASHQAKANDCESDTLEMASNEKIIAATLTYFVECLAAMMGGEGECDSSEYQEACEDEGYDFFTYSGHIDCAEDYYDQHLDDVPSCLPMTCTKDEASLTQIINEESTPEGYSDCTVDIELEDLSAGFSPSTLTGSLALLAGIGAALV